MTNQSLVDHFNSVIDIISLYLGINFVSINGGFDSTIMIYDLNIVNGYLIAQTDKGLMTLNDDQKNNLEEKLSQWF